MKRPFLLTIAWTAALVVIPSPAQAALRMDGSPRSIERTEMTTREGDRVVILRRIENVQQGDEIRLLDEDAWVTVEYVAARPKWPGLQGELSLWIVGDKFPTNLDPSDEVEVRP